MFPYNIFWFFLALMFEDSMVLLGSLQVIIALSNYGSGGAPEGRWGKERDGGKEAYCKIV